MVLHLQTINGATIAGYTNKWSSIASMTHRGNSYYLMENETYGDETCYLLVDQELNVIGETFDDIETAIEDYLE